MPHLPAAVLSGRIIMDSNPLTLEASKVNIFFLRGIDENIQDVDENIWCAQVLLPECTTLQSEYISDGKLAHLRSQVLSTKPEDLSYQKAHYEREMKTYIPPAKGRPKKKFKDPNAPKRPPSAFFLFCSEYRPKIKGEHPGLSIGDVAKKPGEMWNNTAADDKQPCEEKAAEPKEKYEKDIAAYRAKGKPDAAKKGVVKAEKSKKKKEEEDEEEDEEEEEEEEDEEDDDDE
ncbi:high mobility group protein B1-like [Peromyscus californicus insignis]|uniref:high mobility group protein B1-like n=1 Tax=Peromyscus californicus insignis TaxID=564181 RepID=UPI0022A6E6E7|nr:high mobility group protein B1-like [Peromyscus californicus insignis]